MADIKCGDIVRYRSKFNVFLVVAVNGNYYDIKPMFVSNRKLIKNVHEKFLIK